jgi:hypothetical protein
MRQGEDGRRDGGDHLTNVQCKTIQNYHSESLLYNEYMLIKKKTIKRDQVTCHLPLLLAKDCKYPAKGPE